MAKSSRNRFFFSEEFSLPPQLQVFINFHLADLNDGFMSRLISALESNFYIHIFEKRDDQLEITWRRIENSRIALVILSMTYTESTCCLEELTKIKDCVENGNLMVIPIFYKLDPSTVQEKSGEFGKAFKDLVESDVTKKEWEDALRWIPSVKGIMLHETNISLLWWLIPSIKGSIMHTKSFERTIVHDIVQNVKILLRNRVPSEGNQMAYVDPSGYNDIRTSSSGDLCYGLASNLVKAMKNYKLRSQLGMIIGCVLLLLFVLQQIAYMSIGLIHHGGAMHRTWENEQNVQDYIPTEGTKNPIDKYTEFPIGEVGAEPKSPTSHDAKTNADFHDRTYTNSPMDSQLKPPQIQVFINFRGEQLRYNFVSYLVDALRRSKINVFIDNQALRGEDLNTLFKRIEDSGIAIVVFSSRYTESTWCLEELVKIKERVHQGLLKVFPIFYKVTPTNVKRFKGDFGDHFRDKEYTYKSDEPMIKRWKEAIAFVSHKFALTLDEKSSVLEIDFVETIVKEVLKMLLATSTVESGQSFR